MKSINNKSLGFIYSDHPVWAIGFRSFFLAGSFFSIFMILYWSLVFFLGDLPVGYFNPIYWHAHEMIYGFAISIVSGFLLTSTASWTNTRPLRDNKLKLLFCLWFVGRIGMTLSLFNLPISPYVYSLIDLLFIPALIFVLAPPLIKSKKVKNLQFVPILSVLFIANLLIHLSSLEIIDSEYASRGVYLGLNLILIIMVIISGRVIPFVTSNAIAGVHPKTWEWVERAVLISVWTYILLDFLDYPILKGWVAAACGIISLIRISGWKTSKTLGYPLVWILHLGYLWIATGFILVFISEILGYLPRSVAIHAFTAGAMGTFIMGMMSRVSLGHSGRPLKLEKGFVLAYALLTLSAVLRVVFGFFPDLYTYGILASGILWATSFLLFII